MKLECENCQEIDREWPIADGARGDVEFRRRRRMIFHVRYCMTLEEKGEWLRAGGMSLIPVSTTNG